MHDYETGKVIAPGRSCDYCGMREIAPWSDNKCRRCDEDSSDYDEKNQKCPYGCNVKLDKEPFHLYFCRKRRGIV